MRFSGSAIRSGGTGKPQSPSAGETSEGTHLRDSSVYHVLMRAVAWLASRVEGEEKYQIDC
jgi:hypothetical protein